MTTTPKPLTLKNWTLFSTLGWFVGIFFVFGIAILSEVIFKMEEDSGGQAPVGIGMGAGVGLMQWMVLRKRLPTSQRFFWFTLIGFSLAFIIVDIIALILESLQINFKLPPEVFIPITVLFGALLSGWLQYKFIFKDKLDQSKQWIYYSMIGWLLAALITINPIQFNLTNGVHLPKVLILIFALAILTVGGPILGVITGRFIVPKINALNNLR